MSVISTESFTATGVEKTYTVSQDILSKSHCRIDYYYSGSDHEVYGTDWDLLGLSTVVFVDAPTSGYIVKITVSSDGTGLSAAPSDISDVAANIANVNTVAGISGDVTTVAGIHANVTTVAADGTDIGIVATNISNVNAVGTSIANVNTISSNLVALNSVATTVVPNIAEILLADDNATIATTKAGEASTSETNAAASLSSFVGQYVSQAIAPNSPAEGMLWFDTLSDFMKVYDGTAWQKTGSSINGTSARSTYTATAGQTTFNAVYDVGYVDLYLNGIKLEAVVDFIAENGTTVVLTSGASLNDAVNIVAYGIFELADHYSKIEIDNMLVTNIEW